MEKVKVKTIYNGGFVPELGIVTEGGSKDWLVFRHPDGQWVTLTKIDLETKAKREVLEGLLKFDKPNVFPSKNDEYYKGLLKEITRQLKELPPKEA